jgi:hypothetical protein
MHCGVIKVAFNSNSAESASEKSMPRLIEEILEPGTRKHILAL